MDSRSSLGRTAGFTLIEVLIAITLVSLIAVTMLVAIRIALNSEGKTNARMIENRRMLGAQRALEQEINNFMPVKAAFVPSEGSPQTVPFFEGQPSSMRFVSSYSLNQAYRGFPQILEFLVLPSDVSGLRLIVNETPYTGAYSAGARIAGIGSDPNRPMMPVFFLIEPGPRSFVLADRLAYCRLAYLGIDPQSRLVQWRADWTDRHWPLGVQVDMAPLDINPSRLHPITVTASIHADPLPEVTYSDLFDKP